MNGLEMGDKYKVFSDDEKTCLNQRHVCIVGCGGLGGYIFEMLVRLGVGEITIVDGDRFESANLSRQLFSNIDNLGEFKVKVAKDKARMINPKVKVNEVREYLTEDNILDIIPKVDIVVDALDKIRVRRLLQFCCERMNIPFVHGAVAGWYGQVTTIYPGDQTLDYLYPENDCLGIEKDYMSPAFTPALVASIEVCEVVKVLLSKGNNLRNQVAYIDLLNNSISMI